MCKLNEVLNETILEIKTYLSGSLAPWWTRLVNIQEMLVCWVQERIVGGIQLEWCRFVVPIEIIILRSCFFGRRCRCRDKRCRA